MAFIIHIRVTDLPYKICAMSEQDLENSEYTFLDADIQSTNCENQVRRQLMLGLIVISIIAVPVQILIYNIFKAYYYEYNDINDAFEIN